MAAASRRNTDVVKLRLAGFDVEVLDPPSRPDVVELLVKKWRAPPPYDDGAFTLAVHLPAQYPLKSPSVGFRTRIFHPNVDEASGSVCLDVLGEAWSPMGAFRAAAGEGEGAPSVGSSGRVVSFEGVHMGHQGGFHVRTIPSAHPLTL